MKATIIRKSLSFSIFSKYRAEMMGLAIFTVMFRHLLGWLDAGYIEGLYGGVIGFFNGLLFTEGFLLLSGMGLYYSFSKNSNIKVFYIKRIKRLYIPFIIMTFAFYVWSDLILEGGGNLKRFLLDITALYSAVCGNNGMWYVSFSLLLYAFFPFLFYGIVHKKRYAINVAILCLLYWGLYELIRYVSPIYYANVSIGLTKLHYFILGIYLGYLSSSRKEIELWQLLLVMVVMLFSIKLVPENIDYFVFLKRTIRQIFNFSCVMLIFSALSISNGRNIFAVLGKYSLELYVLHLILFDVFFLLGLTKSISGILAIAIAIIMCRPVNSFCKRVVS